MKRIILPVIFLSLLSFSVKGQVWEGYQPHFISLGAGVGISNIAPAKFPGVCAKLEGAYFVNELVGFGLKGSSSLYFTDVQEFVNEGKQFQSMDVKTASGSLDFYSLTGATANIYFCVQPVDWFQFMFNGGCGVLFYRTPGGTVDITNTAAQSFKIEVDPSWNYPFLLTAGIRTNFMMGYQRRVGLFVFFDYNFSSNSMFPTRTLHEGYGGLGATFDLGN